MTARVVPIHRRAMSAKTPAYQTALRVLGLLPPQSVLPLADLSVNLIPREDGLQEKTIAVEQLAHKFIMMRDKLRIMEQRINASAAGDDEKLRLQGRITAMYQALTAFSALFSDDALPTPGASVSGEQG